MNTELWICFVGALLVFAVAIKKIELILLDTKEELIKIRKALAGDKK